MMQQKNYMQMAEESAKTQIKQLDSWIKQCKEAIKGYNKTITKYENRIKSIKSDFKKQFGKDL